METKNYYDSAYQGIPKWDIDFPQPAIVQLEERGLLKSHILDAGCGTGENTIFLAKKGYKVTGMDLSSKAISKARAKARQEQLDIEFITDNILEPIHDYFNINTVLDSCLYHCLYKEETGRYVSNMAKIVPQGGQLFLLCFSEFEPFSWGPRRIKKKELIQSFKKEWDIISIEESEIQCRVYMRIKDDAGRDPNPPTKKVKAWLTYLIRI